jgi:hypothetical protein
MILIILLCLLIWFILFAWAATENFWGGVLFMVATIWLLIDIIF